MVSTKHKNNAMTLFAISLLIVQFIIPISNSEEVKITALDIYETISSPQSIKLTKQDIVATTYSATFTANTNNTTTERTILPIVEVSKNSNFISTSVHERINSVAWVQSAGNQFTMSSRIVNNIYGICFAEQGTTITRGDIYGYSAMHSNFYVKNPSDNFLEKTIETGKPVIDSNFARESSNLVISGANTQFIAYYIVGVVKIEDGDLSGSSNIKVNKEYTLTGVSSAQNDDWTANWYWYYPLNTNVDMDMDLDNSEQKLTLKFTLDSGYFYQTRELVPSGSTFGYRFSAIPFVFFLYYSISGTRTSELKTTTSLFVPENSIGMQVIKTSKQKIENKFTSQFTNLTVREGEITLEKDAFYDYEIKSTIESADGDVSYETSENYNYQNIYALTNIRKKGSMVDSADEYINVTSVPYIWIDGQSYSLGTPYDKRELRGVYSNPQQNASNTNGTAPNIQNGNSWKDFRYNGRTIDLVYILSQVIAFVKYEIYGSGIVYSYVDVYSYDGNEHEIEIVQYWDVEVVGNTYHYITDTSSGTLWNTERNNSLSNGGNWHIQTIDDNSKEVNVYGNANTNAEIGYAELNNGTIQSRPITDNFEGIQNQDTAIYILISTGNPRFNNGYGINTVSHSTTSVDTGTIGYDASMTLDDDELKINDINTKFSGSGVITITQEGSELGDRQNIGVFVFAMKTKSYLKQSDMTSPSAGLGGKKNANIDFSVNEEGNWSGIVEIIPLDLIDNDLSDNHVKWDFYIGFKFEILTPTQNQELSETVEIVAEVWGNAGLIEYALYDIANNDVYGKDNSGKDRWLQGFSKEEIGDHFAHFKWIFGDFNTKVDRINNKRIENGNYTLKVKATSQHNPSNVITKSVGISLNNHFTVISFEVYSDDARTKDANPGQSLSFRFTIKNTGDADTYLLEVGGNYKSWVVGIPSQTNSISTNETAIVTLNINVPSEASNGNYSFPITVKSIASLEEEIKTKLIIFYVNVTPREFVYEISIWVMDNETNVSSIGEGYIGIGTTKEFDLYLQNTKDGSDYLLSSSSSNTNFIVKFSNSTTYTVFVDKGRTKIVPMTIYVPLGISDNTISTITIIAKPSNEQTKSFTHSFSAVAQKDAMPIYNFYFTGLKTIEITEEEKEKKVSSPGTVEYSIGIKNVGNRHDKILLSLILPNGWTHNLSDAIYVKRDKWEIISFSVFVPANIDANTEHTISLKGVSSNTTNMTGKVDFKAIILPDYAFEISIEGFDWLNVEKTINQGESVEFKITVINKGNIKNSYSFSSEMPDAWRADFSPENFELEKGKSDYFTVKISPQNFKNENIKIIVKSGGDGKSKTVNITLNANEVPSTGNDSKFFIPYMEYILMLIALLSSLAIFTLFKTKRNKGGTKR